MPEMQDWDDFLLRCVSSLTTHMTTSGQNITLEAMHCWKYTASSLVPYLNHIIQFFKTNWWVCFPMKLITKTHATSCFCGRFMGEKRIEGGLHVLLPIFSLEVF